MTAWPPLSPSIEEIAALYQTLNARVERLDGSVRQLLAERTRDALPRPTWKDVEALRTELNRLSGIIETCHRKRPGQCSQDALLFGSPFVGPLALLGLNDTTRLPSNTRCFAKSFEDARRITLLTGNSPAQCRFHYELLKI